MVAKRSVYQSTTGLRRVLNALPKEIAREFREESQTIVQDIADVAEYSAITRGGSARLAARTIRAKRDRLPTLEAGSTSRLPGRRSGSSQTYADIIWGVEFGSDRYIQFEPHSGRRGLSIWPAVRAMDITDRYLDALDSALRRA